MINDVLKPKSKEEIIKHIQNFKFKTQNLNNFLDSPLCESSKEFEITFRMVISKYELDPLSYFMTELNGSMWKMFGKILNKSHRIAHPPSSSQYYIIYYYPTYNIINFGYSLIYPKSFKLETLLSVI